MDSIGLEIRGGVPHIFTGAGRNMENIMILLFTIWTIGFVIHLVQVYYNLDYWTHHSLGSELFQPSKTSRIWISDSTNPWTPHTDLPLLEY